MVGCTYLRFIGNQVFWFGENSTDPRVADRRFRPAGFEATGPVDLTGTWIGNDGGSYYLRQVDTTVVWFGETRRVLERVPRDPTLKIAL